MEAVEAFLSGLADWWSSLPPFPDLGLPTPGDPPVLTVVATVVTGLAITGLMTGWIEKRFSIVSFGALAFGLFVFFWLWQVDREGFGFVSIPEAFVEMVARIIR